MLVVLNIGRVYVTLRNDRLSVKSVSKMVKVEAKFGKQRQNVTSESRIESGSKMLKIEAK